MRLIVDLETDGLLQECTKIHCMGVRDVDSEWNQLIVGETEISTWLHDLKGIDHELIFHNGFCFDLEVIKKIYGIDFTKTHRIHDTIILSQLFFGDLKQRDFMEFVVPARYTGQHKLAAWGHRLLCYKGDYTGGWETYSQEMGDYCLQDTEVTKKLFLYFEKIKPEKVVREECIELEYRIAPILARQQAYGVLFNKTEAELLELTLLGEIAKLRQDLRILFKPRVVSLGEVTPKVNSSRYHTKKGATYTKIKFEEYNPGSRQQTIDRLCKELGWTPEEFTDKGNAELGEEIIESLPFEDVKPLKNYYIINKRLGQIANGKKAWLRVVKGNSRIYGGLLQSGTVTGRMTHMAPNLAQCPSSDKLYGKECRQLFVVPPNKLMVGVDADALEMRCCAGYLAKFDNGRFIKTVLEGKKELGTDMHTINAKALGLSRDCAKQWIYAMFYGAKNPKLGLIMQQHGIDFREYVPNFDAEFKRLKNWSKSKRTGFTDKFLECLLVGKKARERYGDALPELPALIKDVSATGKEQGFLRGLDGRKLFCRAEHSMFNTLLQSAGAVIMKKALEIMDRNLKTRYTAGKQYEFILNIHDEIQIEVDKDLDISYIETIAKNSIKEAGEYFKFACPMAGNVMIGHNWAECH